MKRQLAILSFVVLFSATPVMAQTVSPTAAITVAPSATAETDASPVVSDDLTPTSLPASRPDSLPVQNGWFSITLKKLQRFFTRDQVKRSAITLDLTTALLAQAEEEQAAGQADRSLTTLEKYEREMNYLTVATQSLTTNVSDPKVTAFLDTLLIEKVDQLAALDAVSPLAAASLSKKLVQIRAKALRDITKILTNPQLTDAEREKKLTKAIEKYSEKESKVDEKIAKKLLFTTDLEDATEEKEFEDELDNEETELLQQATTLDSASLNRLGLFIADLEHEDSVPLLIKLKMMASTESIDKVAESELEEIKQNDALLGSIVKKLTRDKDGDEAIEFLKQRNEQLKQTVERAREELKQEKEQEREAVKQAEEKTREAVKDSAKKIKEPKSSSKVEVSDDSDKAESDDDRSEDDKSNVTATTSPGISPTTSPVPSDKGKTKDKEKEKDKDKEKDNSGKDKEEDDD